MESQYKEKLNALFSHIMTDSSKGVTDDDIRSLMFGDYLSKGKEEKFYDEILNLDDLREVRVRGQGEIAKQNQQFLVSS